MKIHCFVLLMILCQTAFSCFEQNVRLYVAVDASCKARCADIDFSVEIGGREEYLLAASQEVLIERPITSTVILAVSASVDTPDDAAVETPEDAALEQCRNSIVPKLNRDLLFAKEGNDPKPYIYYDLVYFEDEDMHIDISCSK